MKETEQREANGESGATATAKKKFAIDLRTPEEMQQTTEDLETEAWIEEKKTNEGTIDNSIVFHFDFQWKFLHDAILWCVSTLVDIIF